MFKIVKQRKMQCIINDDGQIIYTPPHFISYRGYDLNKLLVALNTRGFRDIDLIVAFESGKLK